MTTDERQAWLQRYDNADHWVTDEIFVRLARAWADRPDRRWGKGRPFGQYNPLDIAANRKMGGGRFNNRFMLFLEGGELRCWLENSARAEMAPGETKPVPLNVARELSGPARPLEPMDF
jgi:hypothetical protein